MAFDRKTFFLVAFSVIVLALLVYLTPSGFFSPGPSRTSSSRAGQLVNLPEGRQEFTIASAESARPRFMSGVIDPLKVSIGDTQSMRVVLEDDVDVVSAVAEIETDAETVEVPLELVGVDVFARAELEGQKYLVKDGVLIMNDGKLPGALVQRAEAAESKKFTFEGSWIVRDTSVRTYRTRFVATDELGRENSITMAWSDPCSGVNDGADSTLSASCSIPSNTVDGIDNGNLTISGLSTTLTLNGPGAVFVFNQGKSISLQSGGSIVLVGSGAELRQTNLWINDKDGDGYVVPGATQLAQDSQPPLSLYIRRYTILGGNDCYNELPTSTTRAHLVYPGASFQTVPSGNSPAFDYNCDGVESQQYTQLGDANCLVNVQDLCRPNASRIGWYNITPLTPPACGVTPGDPADNYVRTASCTAYPPNCDNQTEGRTQGCS